MKIAKLAVTAALLLFVGATVGMLIAQEVTHSDVVAVEDGEASPGPAAVETGPDAPREASAEAPGERSAMEEIDEPLPSQETAISTEPGASEEAATEAAATVEGSSSSSCVVDAIYFHNTARCYTCRNIEETAKAVLEAEFPRELAEGRLRWSAVNMEEQRHYVEQYSLVKPTLILIRKVGDEPQDWVALDETWTLIRHELRFSTYVSDSTREFLEGCE